MSMYFDGRQAGKFKLNADILDVVKKTLYWSGPHFLAAKAEL